MSSTENIPNQPKSPEKELSVQDLQRKLEDVYFEIQTKKAFGGEEKELDFLEFKRKKLLAEIAKKMAEEKNPSALTEEQRAALTILSGLEIDEDTKKRIGEDRMKEIIEMYGSAA